MPEASQAAYGFAYGIQSIPIFATLTILLTMLLYARGWLALRATRPEQIPPWRLACFQLGMLAVLIAIASPLDTVSGVLLVAHMIQHLLLMAVAPPLIVLGAPVVPMLRGLPRSWVREGIGPLLTLRPVHSLERLLASRVFAWLLMNITFVAWHVPTMYDFALRYPGWHEVEHATFLLTSILFWWHVIAPWPTTYKASRWLLLPFLLTSDFINTGLSAFLSLSGQVVYPVYATAPRFFGLSALADQVAAGSLMWVMGSVSFLGAAMLITVQIVSQSGQRAQRMQAAARERMRALRTRQAGQPSVFERAAKRVLRVRHRGRPGVSQPVAPRFDLLRLRGIGGFLRSRYGRQSLQALSLLIAAAVIVDGLFGHPMGSMNLAGIIPWTYARGIFVFGLLLAGNLFCMTCPFTLPRDAAKWVLGRLGLRGLAWPRVLRNKWLPAVLVALFFWAYEGLDLWNVPERTAILLVAYFLTAFAIDAIFRDATFCKYVCPLGQFNFTASLLSPLEIAPRSQQTCTSCTTRDCIAGHVEPAPQRGCELHLFLPEKRGNTDCTLCLDCVKACPHDNVGLFAHAPAAELVQLGSFDPQRSGVGHFSRRLDLAFLALVVISAAYASAAVMVAPVENLLDRIGAMLLPAAQPVVGMVGALLVPALLLACVAGALCCTTPAAKLRREVPRWSLALLPVGFGMWAAHLAFHLLTAWNSIVPGVLGALHSAGLRHAPANWSVEQPLCGPDAVLEVQFLLLGAGLLGSLYLGWRYVSAGESRAAGVGARSVRLLPWATVACCLYAAGIWILLQPMQMRGMADMVGM